MLERGEDPGRACLGMGAGEGKVDVGGVELVSPRANHTIQRKNTARSGVLDKWAGIARLRNEGICFL